MSKYIYSGVIAFLFLGVVFVSPVRAEATTSVSSMFEQIKALMAKVEELQKQLATIRGEVKDIIRDGIAEGMSGDDIKELQELLASDPSIYPEGKVTGFFGPLTKEAIKRFQERHGLSVTGVVDEETHDLLEEYLKERFGDDVPSGLLKAPGIMKKVENRFLLGCESKKAMGPLCKKLKESSDDDDDDDSNDDDEDELEVEVEIENGTTTVSFTFDGKDYDVEIASTNLWRVLDAVAEDMDIDLNDMDKDLKYEIKKELQKEIEDPEEDDEDEDEDEDDEDSEDEDEND